jgi:antirestriction protein ArdC
MFSPSARARSGSERRSLYDEITAKIVAELEAGRAPWAQPWGTSATNARVAMPTNVATSRRYSGINVLILWGAVIERGFSSHGFLTFRQALGLGGWVRKGERGVTVVFADRYTPETQSATRQEGAKSREPSHF